MFWDGDDWSRKQVLYARYYVKGIPGYYRDIESEELDERSRDYKKKTDALCEVAQDKTSSMFFDSIIRFNEAIDLKKNFIDVFLEKCENEKLKLVLKNEQKKEYSDDAEYIRKYEDISFLNGLVDNFLSYTENGCHIKKDLCSGYSYEKLCQLENLRENSYKYNYKEIFKFIDEVQQAGNRYCIPLFSDIKIFWMNANQNSAHHARDGELLPHTWCDLFTYEEKIDEKKIKKLPSIVPLRWELFPDFFICGYDLDGYYNDSYKLVQPKNHSKKRGFAANAEIDVVWELDFSKFWKHFSWIKLDEKEDYIVNGERIDRLWGLWGWWIYKYEYIESRENYLIDILRKKRGEKIYFATRPSYLNDVLVYRYAQMYPNVDLSEYKDSLKLVQIDDKLVLIRLANPNP